MSSLRSLGQSGEFALLEMAKSSAHVARKRPPHLVLLSQGRVILCHMRSLVKRIAGLVFAEYRLNRIYRLDLQSYQCCLPNAECILRRITQNEVQKCPDEKLRGRSSYGGENAYGFGAWVSGNLASMCWFWNNQRFNDAELWSIGPRDAFMVDLITSDSHRGRGLAAIVTQFAASELKRDSFETAITCVWHSNYPSIRTFEKAGWRYVAFVLNLQPRGCGKPIRLTWKVRAALAPGTSA